MNIHEAKAEIRQFWPDFPFKGSGSRCLDALEHEYGRAFPADVRAFIATVLPAHNLVFETAGNALEVYGFNALSQRTNGYNYNSLTHTAIDGWDERWLLIADEGAAPIIVDVAADSSNTPVLQAQHGEGEWRFEAIASSPAQFLLLAAARHHGLLLLNADERVSDDADGFQLGAKSADWLFPRIQRWAPEYYASWVGMFDNK